VIIDTNATAGKSLRIVRSSRCEWRERHEYRREQSPTRHPRVAARVVSLAEHPAVIRQQRDSVDYSCNAGEFRCPSKPHLRGSASPRILATLPVLVLMFVGQRFIIAGLTLGSVR